MIVARYFTYFFLVCLCTHLGKAQSFLHELDSLKQCIRKTEETLVRSDLYMQMALICADHHDSSALDYLKDSDLLFNSDDLNLRIEHLFAKAKVQTGLELYDSALITFIKVLNISGVKEQPEIVARAYKNIGYCRFYLGHIIECNPPLRKAITIYSDLDNPIQQGECLNLLGQAQQYLGNYSAALQHYYTAKDLFESENHLKGKADVLSNIGTIHTFQKDYNVALETFESVLEIRHQLSDEEGEADCYNKRGVVYYNQHNYQNALNEYLKALKILKRTENTKLEAKSLHHVGRIYELQKKYTRAIEYYYQALNLHNLNHDIYGSGQVNLSLGRVMLKDNQVEKAGPFLMLALSQAKQTGSADIMMEVYENLSGYYATTGETKKFQESWKQFKTIFDTLYTTDKARILKEIQTINTLKQSQQIDEIKISKAELEKQLQEARATGKIKERQFFSVAIGLLVALAVTLLILVRSARRSRRSMELKNKELQETLLSKEEKEVLLKEVHHRVKNNMQIITSLLRLQSVNIEDDYIQSLYTESQNRIKSMALVHEELYQTKDLAELDVKNYLEKLIDNLILNYSLHTKIRVDNNIEVRKLGIDTLIPLGLLLNEIISNSFKHGFSGRETGKIYVSITRVKDKELLLELGDDGIGFETNPADSESLGYELIESLVEQLEGSFKVVSDNGVHYIINFFEQEK